MTPHYMQGEEILDGLSGITRVETERIHTLMNELFNVDGTLNNEAIGDDEHKALVLGNLLKKRATLWKAIAN